MFITEKFRLDGIKLSMGYPFVCILYVIIKIFNEFYLKVFQKKIYKFCNNILLMQVWNSCLKLSHIF